MYAAIDRLWRKRQLDKYFQGAEGESKNSENDNQRGDAARIGCIHGHVELCDIRNWSDYG